MLMNQTVPVPPTARTTHPQIQEVISQTKQALRSEFNARILCLEEEVSRLLSQVQLLTQQLSSAETRGPQHTAPSRRHQAPTGSSNTRSAPNDPQVPSKARSSNTLPFRIVWGTRNSDSSQVVKKAICALLPNYPWNSVTVKRSFRQRASRAQWWYTVMASAEIMEVIV